MTPLVSLVILDRERDMVICGYNIIRTLPVDHLM